MKISTKSPLVSVIIPVFNSERYLIESLRSVINQDYKHIEILIIDGNSTDNTKDVCKSFSEINFYSQEGKGISDALNYGIKKSNGEFISFISSDDLWMHDKLSTQLKFMIKNPELEYTVTKASYFLEPENQIPLNFKEEFFKNDTVQNILETLMVRKTLFDKIGFFDTSFSYGMEVEWFTRAIDYKINFAVVDKVFTRKRVHSNSITQKNKDVFNDTIKALRKSIKRKKSK